MILGVVGVRGPSDGLSSSVKLEKTGAANLTPGTPQMSCLG